MVSLATALQVWALLELLAQQASAQYREGTPQYTQSLAEGEDVLNQALFTHPDVVDDYFPNKEAVERYERYVESFPPTEDFVIGILVNPCGANGTYGREDDIALGYDCCIERFGHGEYAFRPGTRNRFSNGYSNGIPISTDEPLHNIELVDEFGNQLDFQHSRRADDVLHIDESCTGLRDPHSSCIADRFAASSSLIRPPCWDHNQTVDSTLDCYTTEGKRKPHCMQVSYSQNAFIYVCGGEFADDDHCGTYLEIHKENGTPYDDEATVLSDVKITTPITNGMQTTVLPLTYKGDPSRILCSYEEITIQVGSMVRVNADAPSCCCPQWLSPIRASKVGAFFCPRRQWSKDGGPFAPELKSLEEQYADGAYQQTFPWCPALGEASNDVIMCTQERVFADDVPKSDPGRYFVRPCKPLVEADDGGMYSSADLSGFYSNTCPHGDAFQGCGLAPSQSERCDARDHYFSFKDEIGKVVHIPSTPDDGKYGVSFNDGRSVYWFARHELEFLKPEFNYQVWFVQRRYGKIVQKKKPFRVIWPRCTYDLVNDRYYPYAQLDSVGKPIAAIE